MVGVITAVLAGSIAGLVAILASDHSPAAALIAGAVVALMRDQHDAWKRPITALLGAEGNEGAPVGTGAI